MSDLSKLRSILILEQDEPFLQSLRNSPEARTIPLVSAESAKRAQLIVANRSIPLMGIFINASLPQVDFLSVVRASHLHRPATPVFLLMEPAAAENKDAVEFLSDEATLKKLGVREVVQKPIDYKSLTLKVSPVALQFDMKLAIEQGKRANEEVDAEITAEDGSYVAIRAADFLSGSTSAFDVYARLAPGKYVKLLQAGDSFSPDRIEAYLKRGMEFLYMRKDVQSLYLSYCDNIVTAILGSKKPIASEVKVSQTLNHGEETMKFIRAQGISEANLRYATRFVENVRELVQQILPGADDLLGKFTGTIGAYDHGVGVTMLASVLANHLEIKMERPIQIIGVAGLFHDVGLYELPEETWHEDMSKMSPDLKTLFQTHPERGAEVLRKMRVDPSAIQAVLQHHMRVRGPGFPEKTGSGGLNKVAEIIGVCDEFNRLILRMAGKTSAEIQAELEANILPNFSRQIAYAFRSAFFPKAGGSREVVSVAE